MYCPYCGNKCETGHRFCYKCGNPLPVISSEPETSPIAAPVATAESVPVEVPTAVEKVEIISEATPTDEVEVIPGITPPEPSHEEPPNAPVSIMPEVTAAAESLFVQNPAPVPAYSAYFQPASPTPAPIPAPTAPKKGRIWPPLLILGIMMTLGLLLYFLKPSAPVEKLPDLSGKPCFTVTNGVLSFDSSEYYGDGELEVPETIDGQTVTVIGADCFKDCDKLTTVILPKTLKEIDDRAFSGCSNLRGIYIPEGVTRIGNSAFANCSSLEAIYLPESIEIIADRALFRCPKLIHIFYAGKYENWEGLYNGSMPNNTWIYCEDGNYPYTRE